VETLRDHLDRYGTLEDARIDLQWLAELVITERALYPHDWSAHAGAGARTLAILEQVGAYPDFELERMYLWEDELRADDDLCERVVEALPVELVAKQRRVLDGMRRPWALLPDERERFTCALTGEVGSGRCFALVTNPKCTDIHALGDVVFSRDALRDLVAAD
jgi:hypothetical protein